MVRAINTLCILVAIAAAGRSATIASPEKHAMQPKITPFLMFQGGQANEAVKLYLSLFKDGKIIDMDKYGEGDQGPAGTIKLGRIKIGGQQIMVSDSYIDHDFTFTPSTSLFVSCDSEAELDTLFAKLSKDGKVMMPSNNYGFSKKFAWVADRFGVSWQLNLPNEN